MFSQTVTILNKTLTIQIHQDPTRHVEEFFNGWRQFGSIEQISDLEFKLVGPGEKTSTITLGQYEINITGEIPSVSFMLIDQLSRACEADKIIEGEVIDKNQTAQADFNNPFGQTGSTAFKMPLGVNAMFKISSMSKAKLILLLILALPLLIIMLPVIFVVAIYKIIRFKLRF